MLVYPNPSKGIFTVVATETAQVTIINMQGKIVVETPIQIGNNLVDMSKQAQGIYCMKITQQGQQTFKKIVLH